MTVEALAPGTTPVRRRRTLEPYLLKVQEVLRREARESTLTRKLTIEGFSLSLEPWVRACVESPDDASVSLSERDELLRQSLALWLKSALDVRSLRIEIRGGSTNFYEAQAKLMLDSSFGTMLLQELQRCVDRLVREGDLEDAKRLSKFRHQVSGLVRELKQLIAESNVSAEFEVVPPQEEPTAGLAPAPARAPAAAPAPAPAPAPALAPHSVVDARVPETQAPRRRPRPTPPKPVAAEPLATAPSYRTPILVVLDLVALVAWIAFALPSQMRDKPLRVLSGAAFENAAPLVAVTARPPALYATIDEKTWSGFDAKQKRRFIDSMGNVLLTNGYWGLSLRSSDGRLVGEWLETGGTRLLSPGPAVSPSAEHAVPGAYSRFVP